MSPYVSYLCRPFLKLSFYPHEIPQVSKAANLTTHPRPYLWIWWRVVRLAYENIKNLILGFSKKTTPGGNKNGRFLL